MKTFGYTVYGQYTTVRMFVNLTSAEANKLHSTYREWLTIKKCYASMSLNATYKHRVEGILPNQSVSDWIADLAIAKAKTSVQIAQDKVIELEMVHNGNTFHFLDNQDMVPHDAFVSDSDAEEMEDADLPF